MPDIILTEQEVQTLLRCLNDRVEPPEEQAKKLFPVRKKKRFKISGRCETQYSGLWPDILLRS